jgi:hypothetical protein
MYGIWSRGCIRSGWAEGKGVVTWTLRGKEEKGGLAVCLPSASHLLTQVPLYRIFLP